MILINERKSFYHESYLLKDGRICDLRLGDNSVILIKDSNSIMG